MSEALGASWATLGWTAVNAVLVYVALIVYTRVAGLRSFAKMSSFDFAMTIAIGSVIASTVASSSVTAAQGIVALGAIYVLQLGVAVARSRTGVRALVDNAPLLLMAGDRLLEDNLKAGKVTPDELRAKLRESNVLHYGQVRAVVLETTGDVSVLHAERSDVPLDLDVLQGVRGVEALEHAP